MKNTGKIFQSTMTGPVKKDGTSLGEWMLQQFEYFHDKVLFIDGVTGKRWTGAAIGKTVKSYARSLIKLVGVQPHDICCISYDNCDNTVLLALAIIVAGGVVCCPFPLDPYPELLYLAKKTEPKFLFCHSRNQSWARQLNQDLNIEVKAILMDNECPPSNNGEMFHINDIMSGKYDHDNTIEIPVDVGNPDDAVAFITMSSGTTGRPKAIPTTHRNCAGTTRPFVARDNVDVYSCSATLDYVSARIILLGGIESGYATVIMNGFELDHFLDCVSKYKISVAYLGISSLHSMINYNKLNDYDISSLRVVFPMGGRIPSYDNLVKFLKEHPHITHCVTGYGSSEMAGCAINKMPVDEFIKDPLNCGKLLRNVQLKIVDPESGALLSYNQKGLLYVKSPSTSKGYYDATYKYNNNNHNKTSYDDSNQEKIDYRYVKFPEAYDADGFYNSGDIGYMNENEELYCLGRQKELMSCRGAKKVLPQELEEIIQELSIVAEVTVLGIPSKTDIGIDCPRAFVVLNCERVILANDDADLNEQLSKIAKQINDYVNSVVGWEKQLTGGIVILDDIPRLRSTGKVNKIYLRELRPSNKLIIHMDQSE